MSELPFLAFNDHISMRDETDLRKLVAFMTHMGQGTKGPGRIYLTGGSTALLKGWRSMTIDIDIKGDPEPQGFFEGIDRAKKNLNINVELASPDQFIPALPGWIERSEFIARYDKVDFFHFDYYSQALAKIERGHQRDLLDVNAMLARGLIKTDRLYDLFLQIEPQLIRFPSIDAEEFRQQVGNFCKK